MVTRIFKLPPLLLIILGCARYPTAPPLASTTPLGQPAVVTTADKELRDAVLRELLSPSLAASYGTPGSRDVAIFSDVLYQPRLPEGWTLFDPGRDGRPANERPRLLGIRIEASPGKPPVPDEWPSATFYRLEIFNAGGTSNGFVVGLCSGSARAEATNVGCRAQILVLFDN